MDQYGLVANVISDHALRTGARVWILGWNGDAENAQVRGLSKNGRRITKYIKLKRLERFRAAWIPEGQRQNVWATFQWDNKDRVAELAQGLTAMWSKVQFFHRDGTRLRAGEPSSAAFKS